MRSAPRLLLAAVLLVSFTLPLPAFSQDFVASLFPEPPNGEQGDHFGISLAIDGDTAVIGADADGEAGSRAGAAYVYERDLDGNWIFQTKLLPPPGDDQAFGRAVAISGDWIGVGAPNSNFFTGTAFVYRRDVAAAGGWSLLQELLSPNDDFFDRIGIDFDFAIDEEDPDQSILAVGARGDDEFASNGGVVITDQFSSQTGFWGIDAFFAPDDVAEGDAFGSALDLDGNELLVGAPQAQEAGYAAYLFRRTPAFTWDQIEKFESPSPLLGDNFGGSVALYGDLVAVGADAAGVDTNPPAGEIHLFHRNVPTPGDWGGIVFRDPDAQSGDRVGSSLALQGSTLADQFLLLFGANEADDFGPGSGAAGATRIVVETPSANPFQIDPIVPLIVRDLGSGGSLAPRRSAATLAGGDSFGDAVAVSGDIVLVGARFGDRDDGVQTGGAYVFQVPEPGGGLLVLASAATLARRRSRRVAR